MEFNSSPSRPAVGGARAAAEQLRPRATNFGVYGLGNLYGGQGSAPPSATSRVVAGTQQAAQSGWRGGTCWALDPPPSPAHSAQRLPLAATKGDKVAEAIAPMCARITRPTQHISQLQEQPLWCHEPFGTQASIGAAENANLSTEGEPTPCSSEPSAGAAASSAGSSATVALHSQLELQTQLRGMEEMLELSHARARHAMDRATAAEARLADVLEARRGGPAGEDVSGPPPGTSQRQALERAEAAEESSSELEREKVAAVAVAEAAKAEVLSAQHQVPPSPGPPPSAPPPPAPPPSAKPPLSPPLPPELQLLREKTAAALREVHEAHEAAEERGRPAAVLPEGLAKFTTLAKEPAVEAASAELPALELAVAHSPSSSAAKQALRVALQKLGNVIAAKVAERTGGDDLSALVSECRAAIAAGNRDFEKIYKAVKAVIESGDVDGLDAYRDAITRTKTFSRGEAKQRDEAADAATLLADGAACKPAFDVIVQRVGEATGAALELALLGAKDRHGNEMTGLKKCARIIEKAQLRPGEPRGKTDRVCDVVRAMLVAKDMSAIAAIANCFCELSEAGIVDIVRFKDRFTEPSAGGWSDLMINFVVVDAGRARHVCEVQIAHEMMLAARKGLPGHEIYAVVRNASELIESSGRKHELRLEDVRAMRAGGASEVQVIAVFEDAWVVEDALWVEMAGGRTELATALKATDEGRVSEVDFECTGLASLPESLGECVALQTIALRGCTGLASLPESLGECVALQTINLRGSTGLASLPESLGECVALQTINLSGNTGLASLPESLEPAARWL